MAAYAETVTALMKRAVKVDQVIGIGMFMGRCDVTNYNSTLVEITDITGKFGTLMEVICSSISDNGYLMRWDKIGKAFKAHYPTAAAVAHTHDLKYIGGITITEPVAIEGGDKLGKNAAVDRTIAGADVATKGGVVAAAAVSATAALEVANDVDVGVVEFVAYGLIQKMGTLNLTSLIAEVQRHHAGRSDLTDQIVVDKLNLVQERLARVWEWEELDEDEEVTITISSVAKDDKTISLVNTYRDIYSVRLVTGDGTSRKLDFIAKRTFDQMFPEPEFHARNDPLIYTVWKTNLEVYPVPLSADTLAIRGIKWAADFSSGVGGAKSDFDRKDDILIYWTVSMCWDHLGEYERAKRFFGIASNMIDKAKDEQDTKPDLEIKPAFESGKGVGIGQYWFNPFIRWMK